MVIIFRFINTIKTCFTGDNLRGRLLRGGMGSLVVQVARLSLELLLAVFLARVLRAEGYGTYAFAFAVVKVIQIPAQCGISNLALRFTATYKAIGQWGRLRGLWRALILGTFTYGVLSAAALFFFSRQAVGLAGNPTLATAPVLLLLIPPAALVGSMLLGLGHTVSGQLPEHIFRPFAFLALSGLAVCLFGNQFLQAWHAMALHGVAAFIALVLGYLWWWRQRPLQLLSVPCKYDRRKWLKTLLPLSFIGGMAVINNNLDILMLGWMVPVSQVGIYRVAVQGASLVAFSLLVVNFVIAPEIAKLYVQGAQEKLQKMITWSARMVLAMALPVAVIFWLYGKEIINLVFGSDFSQAWTPLVILSCGQLISAAAGSVGYILNMTGHERDVMVGVTLAAAVNIVLNWFLIPRYQAAGAAWATGVSMAVWNIFLVYMVYRRTGLQSTALSRIYRGAGCGRLS